MCFSQLKISNVHMPARLPQSYPNRDEGFTGDKAIFICLFLYKWCYLWCCIHAHTLCAERVIEKHSFQRALSSPAISDMSFMVCVDELEGN